ncbi:MAG: hypothetical protein AAFN94_05820 [Pseudomonadota bacterium]
MNTWISSACLVAACLVAGCDVDLLGSGGASDGLQSAPLSDGAVMLAAPNGFCVDPRSIERRFALMARCDTLGAAGAGGAPLALITATTVAVAEDATLDEVELSSDEERVVRRETRDALTLVQVQGTPPDPSFDDTFWRGRGVVGDQVLGLAIYTPKGADEIGTQGASLLVQTMRRTLVRSRPVPDKSATPAGNRGPVAVLASLFE